MKVTALAVDIGGTFTDVVAALDGAEVRTTKFLSSVCADAEALSAQLTGWISRMSRSGEAPRTRDARLAHATTVATNALLEGRTSRAALVTTEGFRDVLELGRGVRSDPLDLRWRPLPPVVPRERRFTVRERVAADGSVVVPLDWDEAQRERIAEALRDCDAVAICLINSHANASHEAAIARSLRERLPRLFVTCSHEVNPLPREYERTSTTAINAALGPVVRDYLRALESGLRRAGFERPLAVMQSNGGTLAGDLVRARPVSIVESGPAAGVLAAQGIARELDEPNVIALDIGGTTAKASLIENFEILESGEYYVGGGMHAGPRAAVSSGYVIRMPSLDIAEVGAGGGSIASVDEAGGLHVGPRSAGANPGPAAYGLGGESVTVTDANILLGYINPDFIAGGEQAIDRSLAERAMRRHVGEPRSLEVEDAALLVHTAANAAVLAALRAVTIERGRDPRDHLLVAFGGSGPVHATGIADLLGVSRVFVPFGAGVLSAAGLLAASPAADVSQACNMPLDSLTHEQARTWIAVLAQRLQQEWHLNAQEAAAAHALVAVRYIGQHTEIHVPLPDAHGFTAKLREAFEEQYRAEFGFVVANGECEVMGVRLRLRRPPPPDWAPVLQGLGATWRGDGGKSAARRCVFEAHRGECAVLCLDAIADAPAGVQGPAVLETPDTTVVISPGWRASVHRGIGVLLCK
ncbi:MAG TPA: hydantoinase/oxoprolinase family protein [Ramlibacter sp.]|uniref:hydantoinase/oxoprolinase family protein n=1 Tax=Ramlibacter sp. TaxID=1917967 RepID=UPI002C5029E9|nr:hydantoinase/oxoprolinase family protein [Ramlibacter sp.]HVZ42876.1 hydantoinase/oxoprolinase family protein [Ramlibacter sp.]